jgi:hypothetical protein
LSVGIGQQRHESPKDQKHHEQHQHAGNDQQGDRQMAIEAVGPATMIAAALAPTSTPAAGVPDIERFQNAMAAAPSTPIAPAQPVPVAAAVEVLQPVARSGTLGDVILDRLESSSTHVRNAWAEAEQTFNRADLRMSDMLKLQMTVLEASIHYDLISKGIAKANQGLDQMLKTQ